MKSSSQSSANYVLNIQIALFWKSGSLLLWEAFEDSNLFTDRVDVSPCLIVENVEYLKLQPEAKFLDEIEKSLLFTFSSTALPWYFYFFKLTQPLTVSSVQLLHTVKEKRGKPDRKPYFLP